MKLIDIDRNLLADTVARMPDRFYTRDVSEHRAMLDGHLHARSERNYHACVGRVLKQLTDDEGTPLLEEIRSRTKRGSHWEKRGAVRRPAQPATRPSPLAEDGLGPQYAGDPPFRARMRRHQSWYRAEVLKRPCGIGPFHSSTSRYGNMLTRSDGAAGQNFLTPEVFEVALDRLRRGGGMVEEYRLLHNMLSSQPMCFNLFGMLRHDLGLATKLWRGFLGDDVDEVTRVEMEFNPAPKSEYLDDNTAFDAFVEYRRSDGRLGFVGVETKLTEPFSQTEVDKHTYRRWMALPASPWIANADDRVADIRHNQLWRDHLLAFAMLHHGASPYAEGRLLLLYHPDDLDCAATVEGYEALLREDDDTFAHLTLKSLIRSWRSSAGGEAQGWLDDFHRRYVDLTASGS